MEEFSVTSPGPARKALIYLCLIALSAIFIFPLVWMVLTSLKPIQQTVAYPPVWIPTTSFAELDGQRTEVVREYDLGQPSAVTTLTDITGAERKRLVPRASLLEAPGGGYLLPGAPGTPPVPVTVLKEAPAGWVRVSEFFATKAVQKEPRWDVVPPESIHTQIRMRWENYPKALMSLGGRSIEDIEGTAKSYNRTKSPDRDVPFYVYLVNTLIICFLGTVGCVFSNAVAAYGLSRIRWKGREAVFALTLGVMMVPFPVLMVPLYSMYKSFGWVGTWYPLWVPAFFGNAFLIFLMRQFFFTIPEDLSEAARIDGCSEWTIFWRVILPLSKPVLAVAALFHFMGAWNDFMGPLLFLTRKSTFTLAMALQQYQSQHGGIQWHYLMAASTVVVVPIIVLFFLTQKTFIRGIATTGMKG